MLGDEWKVHSTGGMSDADSMRRSYTRSVEGLSYGLGMPGCSFIRPAYIERRGENAMPPSLQLIGEQLPAFRSLSASVNQTVCNHSLSRCSPQRDRDKPRQ